MQLYQNYTCSYADLRLLEANLLLEMVRNTLF